MMQIVIPTDDSVARWVATRLPDDVQFDASDKSVGIAKDDKLIAAAVYHDHLPDVRNCQVSFASAGPGWASKRTVAALLSPAFVEMGCIRITALIRKKNKPSRKLVEGLGFKLEGTLRKQFLTDSMCVYGLLKWEADKWLEKYYGQT